MNVDKIKLTLLDNSEYLMDLQELHSFNFSEKPEAVVSDYIRGRNNPLLKVTPVTDGSGSPSPVLINVNFIMKVDIQYN